jgi:hypothetical protein
MAGMRYYVYAFWNYRLHKTYFEQNKFNYINFNKFGEVLRVRLGNTAIAGTLSIAARILIDYLPPTKSRTDKTNSYPCYNDRTNTEPGTTSSQLHKLLGLGFGDGNPR